MNTSLKERDGLIARSWVMACLSNELKRKPIQRIIYDRPYVLFRDKKGNPVCLLDRCLHRHALLSKGVCIEGEIKCPYHGWNYNEKGVVTSIPSEGPLHECSKHKTISWPTCEKDGVIWVWTFDETPNPETPPWNFPKARDKNWIHYFMVTDFKNEVTNLAENFMDVPHTVFVHKGWFRNNKKIRVPMKIQTKEGRVLVTYQQERDEIAPLLKPLLNPHNLPMEHTDEFIFPNITNVTYTYGPNYGFIINSQCTPISTMESRVYTYIAYRISFGGNFFKPFLNYYTKEVIRQDVEIMANQGKSLSFDPKTTFRSTPADEVHTAIERLRHWGVTDPEKVYRFENSVESEFWV